MHIAICDDNVADRKHLERLLSRESDKRFGTPNILYVDSYGKKENLLNNPLKYDLFFIDMVSTPTLAKEIVFELKRLGVTAPIIMYSSSIDYTLDSELPKELIHRKKPYVPEPLPELLALGDAYVTGVVLSINITVNGKHQLIPVNDIYYAYSDAKGVTLVLKDQTSYNISESLNDVYYLLEPYEEFVLLNKHTIINLKFTSLITYFTVMMQDYKEFHFNPFIRGDLLELKKKVDSIY